MQQRVDMRLNTFHVRTLHIHRSRILLHIHRLNGMQTQSVSLESSLLYTTFATSFDHLRAEAKAEHHLCSQPQCKDDQWCFECCDNYTKTSFQILQGMSVVKRTTILSFRSLIKQLMYTSFKLTVSWVPTTSRVSAEFREVVHVWVAHTVASSISAAVSSIATVLNW